MAARPMPPSAVATPQRRTPKPEQRSAPPEAEQQAPPANQDTAPAPAPTLTAQPMAVEAPHAGNPGEGVDTSRPKVRPDYTEIGSSGLQQSGGYVYEEFLRALQGDRGIKTLREMADNDPVIGGMLFAVEMMCRQVDWHLEPAFVAPPTPPAPGPPPMPVVGPGAQLPIEQERARQAEAAQGRQFQHESDTAAGQRAHELERDESGRRFQGTEAERQRAHERDTATQAQIAQIGQAAVQSGGPGSRDKKNPIVRKSFGAAALDQAEALDEVHALIRKAMGEPVVGDDEQVYQAEEAAAFVESCFLDMSTSWEDTLSAILSMITYGWSYFETILKRRLGPDQKDGSKRSKFDDGKIGWRKIALRAQDSKLRWEIDTESDGIKGMWQQAPNHETKFLPIERCLLFRTTTAKGNPEGRSALRNAFRPWYFKRRIEEIEAIGIERDLAGMPIAWLPYEFMTTAATAEQRQVVEQVKHIVRNIKRDEQEGIVFPLAYDEGKNKLFDLTLLSTGGQRAIDTDKIIARYDQRIAMTMLADFILLGHENVGSKALGASKIDLFTAAIEAWLFHIADVFNTHAIPRLLRLNGIDVRYAPKLTFGSIQPVDLTALGTFLQALSGTGMPLFPDEELESYLRTAAGLPAKSSPPPEAVEEEEL